MRSPKSKIQSWGKVKPNSQVLQFLERITRLSGDPSFHHHRQPEPADRAVHQVALKEHSIGAELASQVVPEFVEFGMPGPDCGHTGKLARVDVYGRPRPVFLVLALTALFFVVSGPPIDASL